LKSEYDDVREYAADALGDIGDERAVEALNQALNDEYTKIRAKANSFK